MSEHVTHAQIMAELVEVKKRLTAVEATVKPLGKVVTALGGAEPFIEHATEALEGLRTLQTLGKWTKAAAAMVVAVGAIAASIKFAFWDMWRIQ